MSGRNKNNSRRTRRNPPPGSRRTRKTVATSRRRGGRALPLVPGPSRTAGTNGSILHLPREAEDCLANYTTSVLDPFESPPLCAPYAPMLSSGKYKTFARGEGAIGTLRFAFVSCHPSFANDTTAIRVSDEFYLGTTIATVGTGVTGHSPGGPFANTAFGNDEGDIQGRAVACGIRLRYAGTELERSGSVLPFRHSDNRSLTGYDNVDLLKFEQANRFTVDKKWKTVIWLPVSDHDRAYTPGSTPDGLECMGITLTGTPGQLYEWEYVCLFEVIGSSIYNKSPTFGEEGIATRILSAISSFPTFILNLAHKVPEKTLLQAAHAFVRGVLDRDGLERVLMKAAS